MIVNASGEGLNCVVPESSQEVFLHGECKAERYWIVRMKNMRLPKSAYYLNTATYGKSLVDGKRIRTAI